MNFLIFNSRRKHEQVIQTVMAYFNEETSHIPYTSAEIEKTIRWLSNHTHDQEGLLKAKLQMAVKLTAAHG